MRAEDIAEEVDTGLGTRYSNSGISSRILVEQARLKRWSPTLSSMTRSGTLSHGGLEKSSVILLVPPVIRPLGRSAFRHDDHHAQNFSL